MKQYIEYTEQMKESSLYLAALLKAALKGTKAPEKPASVSWQTLYQLVCRNSIEGLSAYGVETLEAKPPAEIWNTWQQAYQRTLYRVLNFDVERELLLADMKLAGLSYLPMKGIHIVNYYPKPGMRTMADNDILFGFVEEAEGGGYQICGKTPEQQKASMHEADQAMRSVMLAHGYTAERPSGTHTAFHKKPIFNFEMHERLVYEESRFGEYYKNPWKRAVQDEQDSNGYHFSDEDEFLFLLVHAKKHLDSAGIGFRFLTDVAVFLEKKGASMDMEYIRTELQSLGLAEFGNQMIRAAEQILMSEDNSCGPEMEELIYFFMSCGTYGNMELLINQRMDEMLGDKNDQSVSSKLTYIWHRFFPDDDWYRKHWPMAYKYPVLKPFVFLYRLTRSSIKHRDLLRGEWRAIWRKKTGKR